MIYSFKCFFYRSEAFVKEKELTEKIIELQMKAGPVCLGRDRAYRRYWVNICIMINKKNKIIFVLVSINDNNANSIIAIKMH